MLVTILLVLIPAADRLILASAGLTNVALNKTATQSNLDGSLGSPETLVDGQKGNLSLDHCTQTMPQPSGRDQWVRVDLEDYYDILEVGITTSDCCVDSITSFDIVISRELSDATDGWQKNSHLCAHHQGQIGQGATLRLECPAPIVGRYVTWVKPMHNQGTSLCEMEVFSSGRTRKLISFSFGFYTNWGSMEMPTTNEFDFQLSNKSATRPAYLPEDHTGSGSYSFMQVPEVRNPKKPNSTGNLMSPVLSTDTPVCCLTFYYQLTGSKDDMALEVTRSSDVGPSPITVWSLKTPYNIKEFPDKLWRRADVTMDTNGTSIMWFNMIMTYSNNGDIGVLDDIKFAYTPCLSGIPVVDTWSCDFDDKEDLCGMGQPTDVDDNDWMRQTGNTSTKDTGPDFDHTQGDNGTGHYVYFETSGFVKHGDSAVLVTPTITPTMSDVSCVSFALHKHGLMANLAVKIATQEPFLYNESSVVWEDSANHGPEWVTVEVTVQTPGPYKIFFKAEKKDVSGMKTTDIAIDDVTITNQDCPTSAVDIFKCSMDDMCGFRQLTTDNIDWILTQNASDAVPTPWANLKSTGPGTGGYLTLGKGLEGETAQLVSPTVDSGTPRSCLTFWTHVYMGTPPAGTLPPPTLGGVTVFTRPPPSMVASKMKRLWRLDRVQENRWRRTALTIDTSSPVELVIQGAHGNSGDSQISIDDIQLDPGPCLQARTPKSNSFQCDFSSADLCGFHQSASDVFDWFQHEGPVPDVATTGPARDHTGQSADAGAAGPIGARRRRSTPSGSPGGYMYLESSWPQKAGDKAVLISPNFPISSAKWKCLTVWYYMSGEGSSLVITNKGAGQTLLLFGSTRSTAGAWKKFVTFVRPRHPFRIYFEGMVGQTGSSVIALDDISLTDGMCIFDKKPPEPNVDCDFSDSFLCGYQQGTDDGLDWKYTEGGGLQGDHMHVGDYIPKSVLVSPSLRWSFGKSCLKFRVNMVGNASESGSLDVYLAPTGVLGERTLVWNRTGDSGEQSNTTAWRDVSVDIDTPYPVQLIFEGTRGAGANATSLDDIVVLPWECDNPVSCDFTADDPCTYVADHTKLRVNKGKTKSTRTGPTGDHTTGTDHYLYLEASGMGTLRSGAVPWNTPVNCLGVWYHMYGSCTDYLEVYAADPDDRWADKQELMYVNGERGDKWFHGLVEFNASNPIRIYFEMSRGGTTSDIAIDDIYGYKNMPCSDVKPWMVKGMTSGVNCNFDNGLCGYTQMNQELGYTDWLQAPDESGEGMVLQLDTPLYTARSNSSPSAVLISPELTGPPRKICLTLDYYVQNEPDEVRGGVLMVTAVDSSTSGETVKTWSRNASDSQNLGWQTGEIDVDFKGPMTFRFQATPTPYGNNTRLLADIAFDNVTVTDGTCEPEVPWTEDPAFRCDRPTTPCAPGREACDPDLHTCTCTLPGAAGLQCTSECSNTNTAVDCTCPDGYYGDECQLEMFHVECDHTTMLVNIRPHGFTKAVFKGIKPPEIRDTPCSLHSMDVFGARNPTYAALGWQGYAAKFLLTDDLCAGSASLLEETADNITYSLQVNVYYGSSERHPTDTNLTLTCTAPKPKPRTVVPNDNVRLYRLVWPGHHASDYGIEPSVTIAAFVLGVSALSRNPMTVNSDQWPTYMQFKFSLNIPNSAEMTEVAVEKCDASNGAQSLVVVANACAVHPTGVMLFDGEEPGTEFLMLRVYNTPGSPLDVTLRCSIRLCNTNKNNMSCYRRKMCLRRKKRASGWNQGTMLQDVTGHLQLDEGGRVHFNFTSPH